MLVRFLSYAASIIGAKRYKPLLIACLALVLSVSGISFIMITATRGPSDAASQVEQRQQDSHKKGQEQTSLGSLQQKSVKEPDSNVIPSDNQPATNPDDKPTDDNTANSPLEITLNTATVSLSQDSPSSAVLVAANQAKDLVWTVSSDAAVKLNPRVEPAKDNSGNAVVRFRAETDSTPGAYQFTVSAKNTVSGQSASKTISVTVN